jgi:hypothetical protein
LWKGILTLEITPVTNIFEKLLTVTLSWASLPRAYAVSSIGTVATLFEGPSLVELLVWYFTMSAHSAIKVTVSRANTCVQWWTCRSILEQTSQRIWLLKLNRRLCKPLETAHMAGIGLHSVPLLWVALLCWVDGISSALYVNKLFLIS